MAADLEPGAGGIEEAERRGYLKGLNLGLLTVAIPCGLLAAGRSFYDVPHYEDVFRQIKVPMPGLTLLVIQIHQFMAVALLIGAAASGAATRLWGHRRRTVVLNGIYLFLGLTWMTAYTTALHLPMMSLLEGLGMRQR